MNFSATFGFLKSVCVVTFALTVSSDRAGACARHLQDKPQGFFVWQGKNTLILKQGIAVLELGTDSARIEIGSDSGTLLSSYPLALVREAHTLSGKERTRVLRGNGVMSWRGTASTTVQFELRIRYNQEAIMLEPVLRARGLPVLGLTVMVGNKTLPLEVDSIEPTLPSREPSRTLHDSAVAQGFVDALKSAGSGDISGRLDLGVTLIDLGRDAALVSLDGAMSPAQAHVLHKTLTEGQLPESHPVWEFGPIARARARSGTQ